jgi:DNA (cytosine-5)-methyltransferase 1
MSIRAIDLFCGAGGLTRGLLDAGIDVVAGFDVDEACSFAYETNNGTKFVQQDLARPDISLMKKLLIGPNLKLIAGCAPCQRFSSYNRHRKADNRSWPLLDSFSKIVTEIKPDFVTMENVAGIERDPAFSRFFRNLENLGYSVAYDVLDCRHFGMAQQRRRLVLIASRGRRFAELPEGTITDPRKFSTVRKILGKLPAVDSGSADKNDPIPND